MDNVQNSNPLALVEPTDGFPFLGYNSMAVIAGAELFSGLVTKTDASIIQKLPYIIQVNRNILQQRLAAFLFYVEFKRYVDSIDAETVAWQRVEKLQNELRQAISDLFKTPAQLEKEMVDRWLKAGERHGFRSRLDRMYPNDVVKNLAARQKEAHKPHAQGTVAELATKLGVSKSEVRRLKQEGLLEDALSKLN